ncbi:MAG: serine hydrolase [Candidatus Aminicenantales bacterium]
MKPKFFKTFSLCLVIVFLGQFSFGYDQELVGQKRIERLKGQIENLLKGIEGEVGVAVKHLESGESLYINGDVYFPMASVFKIPILVEVLNQVKEGKLNLEDEVDIRPENQHLGSGLLSSLSAPGIKLSIRNLINLMMMISDNSATDILLTTVGPERVNQRLRSYGLKNITVNRTCQQLIMDYLGLEYDKYKNLNLTELRQLLTKQREENPSAFKEAGQRFSQIIKDQSTPRAMNRLLELIYKKKIIDEESCDFIVTIMLKCQTGKRRIKGDLPPQIKVAHKTGTIGGTINDCGLIFLPQSLGHVALTIFTKNMSGPNREVEDIIAQIARFVFDYFYFTSSNNNE